MIKKTLFALGGLAALAAAVLYGSYEPRTAELVVKPAQAAQCSYIAAMRTACMGDGCSYATTCRPSVCPQSTAPKGPMPGYLAHKGWMNPPTMPPDLTLHSVSYQAGFTSGGTYPTCDSYFNKRENWEAP